MLWGQTPKWSATRASDHPSLQRVIESSTSAWVRRWPRRGMPVCSSQGASVRRSGPKGAASSLRVRGQPGIRRGHLDLVIGQANRGLSGHKFTGAIGHISVGLIRDDPLTVGQRQSVCELSHQVASVSCAASCHEVVCLLGGGSWVVPPTARSSAGAPSASRTS
jgi:hypothetical protein